MHGLLGAPAKLVDGVEENLKRSPKDLICCPKELGVTFQSWGPWKGFLKAGIVSRSRGRTQGWDFLLSTAQCNSRLERGHWDVSRVPWGLLLPLQERA